MNFLSDKIKVTWDTRIYSQFVFQHVLKNARHRSIVVLLRLLFYDFLIRYLTWAIKWIRHFRSILIKTIVITNIQIQLAILISRGEIQADVIIHFDFKAILISILIRYMLLMLIYLNTDIIRIYINNMHRTKRNL